MSPGNAKQAIRDLRELRGVCDSTYHAAINEALRVLEPIAVPPDAIHVRIAVAVANYPADGGKNFENGLIIGAVGIDECDDADSAMHNAIDRVSDDNDGQSRSVIATAFMEGYIPRIPTVQGRVESEVRRDA